MARAGRLLRGQRPGRDAGSRPARRPARAPRARLRDRHGADERRLVALDLPDRPPRRDRGAVGLDDPRAVGCAAPLRRRALAPRRRLPQGRQTANAPRAAAARPLGEPPRLGRARRRPDGAARDRRARAQPPARVDPRCARRPRPALRARVAVRHEARGLLQPDARRRAVRADPPRMAVVEPERDDGAVLVPRARRRAAPRIPSLPQQADGLRARRARRDVRRRGAGRAGRDLVRPRLRGDPSRRARRPSDESGRRRAEGQPRRSRSLSLAGLAVAIVAFLAHSASWYVSDWHEQQIAAVRKATRDPSTRVWATDGTADWLLWRIPELRGRIAYDVRFELYDQATLDRIVDYQARRGDWKSVAKGTAS